MATLDQTSPVGEWVTEFPQSARVFEDCQIDYCCGGGKPLNEVCEARGIDVDTVCSKLGEVVTEDDDNSQPNWAEMPLGQLCDVIEETHHSFLKTELPRLTQLVEKVATVHGDRHPELIDLRTVYAELRAELEPHMMKEENILFPAIRTLENAASQPEFPFGSVSNPIRMMEHEHDNAGNALKRIRELTQDFLISDHVCNTWRVMLDSLENLEKDLHQHIHKENNILFPRTEQLTDD